MLGHNRALAELNARLRFPESDMTYARMVREDAQVASLVRAVTLPIERSAWWVEPNGADDEVVRHVAADLRLNVLGDDLTGNVPRSGRVSWSEHLNQALTCLIFGYAYFEQVYELGDDGREHLRKLSPRRAGTISAVNVADDGGLESIEQRVDGNLVTIPVDRLVAYVYQDTAGTWTGTSMLRAAYKHWVLRDELLELEQAVLERNGMGVPIYTGSDLVADPDSDLERGEDIATDFRSGRSAGAAIPAGAKFDLKGVSGQLVSPREAIRYHDAMIMRVGLAHFLNLENGGSYALSTSQSDFFNQNLQSVADSIAETASRHIVEDLLRVAFPDYEGPCPRITCDAITGRQEMSPAEWAQAVANGVVYMDPPTEQHYRRTHGVPPKQSVSEALENKAALKQMEAEAGVTLSGTEEDTK